MVSRADAGIEVRQGAYVYDVLPERVMGALCLAIYAMFVAIIIPEVRAEKTLGIVVGVSVLLSTAFYYLPILKNISSGLAVTVCAIVAAVLGALFFPKKDEEEES
jgi:predicted branched-subunit amino acid permease